MMKIFFQILLFVAIANWLWACGGSQTSENKEVELLRKETELAKKEAELAKKELEMSKDNSVNSNANTSTVNINSTATPSQPPKPTKVKVRLEPVWINGVGSALYDPNMTAILTTSAGRFSGKVNGRGVIIIANIPCDEQINISLPPTHGFGGDTKYYKRFIKCDKSTVNLGKLKVGSFDDF